MQPRFGASIAPDRGLSATCPMRHFPNAIDQAVHVVPDNPVPDQNMDALARSQSYTGETESSLLRHVALRSKASKVINCEDYVRK